MSCSAILDAHQKTHGARVLPHYLFDRADVLVSFGADFLGTWISPVEFTAAWQTRRVPNEEHPVMSYHAQFESRMSLTGGNADRRFRIRPEDQGPLLGRLAEKIASLAGELPASAPLAPKTAEPIDDQDAILDDLAQRLWKAREESLVVCDSQDVNVQVLVNYINHLLGSYGKTIDIQRPSRQRQGNDAEVARLIEELKAGQVVHSWWLGPTSRTIFRIAKHLSKRSVGFRWLSALLSEWTTLLRLPALFVPTTILWNLGWMPSLSAAW